MTGRELFNIAEAHFNGMLAGDGPFTRRCHAKLESVTGTRKALLTHSCTAALEMAALLARLGPGDEVIVPSFTFVSTANAFVLRGAKPVFVDVRSDTLNIDEKVVEASVTPHTKAIFVVHYAGVVCDMDVINAVAREHRLIVVEDAAQAVLSTYRARHAGTLGDLGAVSFHETKNVISGEGGALYVNRPQDIERAEILREKGTNRSQFFRGEVDKYTWCEAGSSFLPGELMAAFLSAQLQEMEDITARRLAIWQRYHDALAGLETRGLLRRPVVPPECVHNAHMYYVLLPGLDERTRFIRWLKDDDIHAVFHYVPLHTSPFGQQFEPRRSLPVTDDIADRLVRLPLWIGIEPHLDRVLERIHAFFR
jgi:dTDP-4-amino-4,6-dideoxygalactose transaminase